MGQLYLLRHGQSTWNRENRFTGWEDVPLTPEGQGEMVAAGQKLRGVHLNRAYSSALQRTRQSAQIVLSILHQEGIPLVAAPELNERFYGALQGQNKAVTTVRYGEELVHRWRRSYTGAPPGGESLQDAAKRILPYFERTILPQVAAGQNILVCAHGNTLRVIRMCLDDLDEQGVMNLEIPTGGLCRYEIGTDGKVLAFEML